jgi:DNA-binding NarL/FixJ family response regulator
MAQFPRLSNREWDVLKFLLQGKSNKLIALSLRKRLKTCQSEVCQANLLNDQIQTSLPNRPQ